MKTWVKKNLKGYFEKIRVYCVTRSYFYDDKKVIWKGSGKWEGELFPHRFEFDSTPIINLININISSLAETSKQELHDMVYGNLINANPSTLVDIVYHGNHP